MKAPTVQPEPIGLVEVSPENMARLPAAMVDELGSRIWFLRGYDRWEAWSEPELEALLGGPVTAAPVTAPTTASIPHVQFPTLRELQKAHVVHVIALMRGNKTRAARVLGIDRRTLYRMLGKKV